MIKILFICHGNICRSVMAEYIFKDMVKARDDFYVESAAVSREELGNDIYPPAQRTLRTHSIRFEHHAARQITKNDYERFDHIYVMDESNMRRTLNIFGGDIDNKVKLLLERGIADPWYTGEFERTYNDIVEGCQKILTEILGV